ncbi:MAG: hypothetical protein DRI26_03975 [Chloroflexi bacterium]|nr:MAG: hypothetical protein DRI26_03975 [Chloroflexota bacterium]
MSLQELDQIIAKIRYVKWGDYVLPEDHNYLLDAIKKIRDILAAGIGAAAEEPDIKDIVTVTKKKITVNTSYAIRKSTDYYGTEYYNVSVRTADCLERLAFLMFDYYTTGGEYRTVTALVKLPTVDVIEIHDQLTPPPAGCFGGMVYVLWRGTEAYRLKVYNGETGDVIADVDNIYGGAVFTEFMFPPGIPTHLLAQSWSDTRYAYVYERDKLVKTLLADYLPEDFYIYTSETQRVKQYYSMYTVNRGYKHRGEYIVAHRPNPVDDYTVDIYVQVFEIQRT